LVIPVSTENKVKEVTQAFQECLVLQALLDLRVTVGIVVTLDCPESGLMAHLDRLDPKALRVHRE